jgi:hypothetical protein
VVVAVLVVLVLLAVVLLAAQVVRVFHLVSLVLL